MFGASIQLNPFNTVIYSAVLAGVAVLLVSRIKEADFNLDKKFFLSSTPLLILTGFILGLSNTSAELPIANSPYRFILAGLVAASILAGSLEASRKGWADLHRVVFVLPLPGILLLLLISPPEIQSTLRLAFMVAAWSFIGFLTLRTSFPELQKLEFLYPLFAHYLDASTSFIAISGGAREKMFPGILFVENFGAGGIFVLKSLIIVPLTYYIFRNFEGEERMNLLYLITALGIVVSSRNFLGL